MRARLVLLATVLLAGCLGAPGTGSPDRAGTPAFEARVFDHAGVDRVAIEGGLRYDPDRSTVARYYVTTVTSTAETARFDRSVVHGGAWAFIENTSFDRSYLVVIQATPASSVPDYRVESVRQQDGTLHVAVDDSSRGGTADVTVETVLLRVRGDPPDQVTVRTEEGRTFSTGTHVVTPAPTPAVDLPYAAANDSANVASPRDLRIVNEGAHTNSYHVTVAASERPACRDLTPACGRPNRLVTLVEARGKLPPAESRTWRDVVARRGDYVLTVSVAVPADDGGRRTVTRRLTWHVDERHGDAVLTVTDEGVALSQAA
ncbi:MAG: hypothetical protein ABEJ82_01830 [Haloplanus sp.]